MKTMAAFELALVILATYLVGSIPFGYWIARWHGIDLFQHGSGNIGATNVGRVLGRRLGILVFVLDFAKGAVPVGLCLALGPVLATAHDAWLSPKTLGAAAGLAAFLGHLFPVYLRFRGGKGVATGAGVIVVLVPVPAFAAVIVWVGVVCATRYVSLASLAAALTLFLFQLKTTNAFAPDNQLITLFCALAAGLVFLRHRANLARLFHGTENQLPDGPAMFTLGKTIHVISLGLWFGTIAFFMLVALTVFDQMESLAQSKTDRAWFPKSEVYQTKDPAHNLIGPKEQGSRVAGYALSPLFPQYFALQGVCAFLAIATAWAWPRKEPGRRVHQVRGVLLFAALVTVVIGWPLEQKVDAEREPRHEAVEKFLKDPSAANLDAAVAAKKTFAQWHMMSLMLNFVTFVLVGVCLGLAAQLPEKKPSSSTTGKPHGADQQVGGSDPPKVLTHSS
jgi:glycerol-3-phosphate acyltransferase PlsY